MRFSFLFPVLTPIVRGIILPCALVVAFCIAQAPKAQAGLLDGDRAPVVLKSQNDDPVPYWCWTTETIDAFKECSGPYIRAYSRANAATLYNDAEAMELFVKSQLDVLETVWYKRKGFPPVPLDKAGGAL